jgi:hypothetical protein
MPGGQKCDIAPAFDQTDIAPKTPKPMKINIAIGKAAQTGNVRFGGFNFQIPLRTRASAQGKNRSNNSINAIVPAQSSLGNICHHLTNVYMISLYS